MRNVNEPVARGLLTKSLVDFLTPILILNGIYTGRGLAPTAGGWTAGQPGTSNFVGYTVVKTGRASLLEADPLGRGQMSWRCNYSITSSGGNEAHADDVADRVRAALSGFPDSLILREVLWGVQKVDIPELGPVVSSTAVDPPFWSVTDAVSLWLSRSRAR